VSKDHCTGGLESLFHVVAKQILKSNDTLVLSENNSFVYDKCDVETPRHGKRPDAFIANEDYGLIVEVFFSHRINPATLEIYLANNENILEIDISCQRKQLFNYSYLEELILNKAPRTFSRPRKEKVETANSEEVSGWGWLGIGLAIAAGFFLMSQKKSSNRNFWENKQRNW